MTFEVHKRGKHVNPRIGGRTVLIAKQTRIVFSKECTTWLVSRGIYVEALFDREAGVMAFKPMPEQSENAYKLVVRPRQIQTYASVRAFLKWIGSPLDGKYDAILNDAEGIISVKLEAPLDAGPCPEKEGNR